MADAPSRPRSIVSQTINLTDAPSVQAFLSLGTHGEDGPTDAPIYAIHRGPSGVIPLARKGSDGHWQQLGALALEQRQLVLPDICRALLGTDAYFAINSSYGKPQPRSGRVMPVQPPATADYQPASTATAWINTNTPKLHGVTRHLSGAENDAFHARYLAGELGRGTPNTADYRGWQPRGTVQRKSTALLWKHPDTGLQYVEHSKDTLRWLNAAYSDLDGYKLGLTAGDIVGGLIARQDAGIVPPATIFVRSGRGVWALWLLVDVKNPTSGEQLIAGQVHQPWTPQRASDRAVKLYARVQRALQHRLSDLGADLGAIDGPRYTPVPGTIKTSAQNTVLYWPQLTPHGLPAYTLPALAAALGLAEEHEHPVIDALYVRSDDTTIREKNPAKQSAGLRGYRAKWAGYARIIDLVCTLRADRSGHGGYGTRGSRHEIALLHAVSLYRSGMSVVDMSACVRAMWDHSRRNKPQDVPPEQDLADILKQAVKRQTKWTRLRRSALLQTLQVTPAEQSYLDTLHHGADADTVPTTPKQKDRRRQAIRRVVREVYQGQVPSVRDLAAHLSAAGVPSGNHVTIWRDLQALGLISGRKAGRPPKLPL